MEHVVVVSGRSGTPSVYGPFPDEESARGWVDKIEADFELEPRVWVAPLDHEGAFEPPQ
jgi:hypothetical protein